MLPLHTIFLLLWRKERGWQFSDPALRRYLARGRAYILNNIALNRWLEFEKDYVYESHDSGLEGLRTGRRIR
jgi:hypothetical protein